MAGNDLLQTVMGPHISRLKAGSIHLLASAVIAALAAALVFGVWYPSPLQAITGGVTLFAMLVGIDVVLGPMLTLVIASPSKPRTEFRRDLAIIVAVQLAAFAYGLYTMALARPVLLVFEVDRFRVVTAADVDPAALSGAPSELRRLSWTGPQLIATVKPTDPAEQMRSLELALGGIDLAMQPKQWREYAPHADEVWRIARPVSVLLARYPLQAAEVRALAQATDQPAESLRFLPLTSRRDSWVSLIANPGARVVGHLPVDGFF